MHHQCSLFAPIAHSSPNLPRFVQSARFVENHQRNPSTTISIYGQEKTQETVNLYKMNLTVHDLSGDIKQTNSLFCSKGGYSW